jgi:hypothetical protein
MHTQHQLSTIMSSAIDKIIVVIISNFGGFRCLQHKKKTQSLQLLTILLQMELIEVIWAWN